jgi:hypothetical protein
MKPDTAQSVKSPNFCTPFRKIESIFPAILDFCFNQTLEFYVAYRERNSSQNKHTGGTDTFP